MNNSKLSIGTVQFGMQYGVANNLKKTDVRHVVKILDTAHKEGINALDTAPIYGNSEVVLGEALCGQNWNITTKIPPCEEDVVSASYLKTIKKSLCHSLLSLGVQIVDGLLVHNCDDLFKPGGRDIFFELKKLQSLGLIKKIGVSVYTKDQILRVLDNFDIDLIQLPINILDQRLIHSGCLEKLNKKGVEIHARSVFLQGLLLMPLNMIPDYFSPIIKNIKNFNEDANSLSMTALELALNYVVSIHEVDRVIVGVNTVQHIEDITSCKFKEITLKDFRGLSVKDPNFLNPSLWPSW